MSYTELDLSSALLFYGAASSPGTIGASDEWSDFAFPSINIDFTQHMKLQLDLETGNSPQVFLYSLLPNNDPDASAWWQLVEGTSGIQPGPNTTTTVTITFGPTLTSKWASAQAAGESHVLIEVGRATVVGARWEMAASFPELAQARIGQYVLLDETPLETGTTNWVETDPTGVYNDYQNYYTTGCRVWPDVAFAAWTSQGQMPNAYEGRAIRWSDAEDMVPELGPLHVGPLIEGGFTYNGVFTPYTDGTISWVGYIAPGVAFIGVSEVYDNSTTAGWVVKVDQDTLAVTYVQRVDCPQAAYVNDDFALIAEGDGRLLFMGAGQNSTGDASFYQVLCSLTWNGSSATVTWSFPTPGNNNYWEDTTALVDMGDTFVRITQTQDYTNGSTPVNHVLIYSHPTVDGHPSDNGTLRLDVTPQLWDYDEVYAERINDTTIHVVHQALSSSINGYVQTLDTSTWTLSPQLLLPGSSNAYNSAHQLDFKSVDKIDDTDVDTGNKSLVAWTNYYNDQANNGTRVAIWDGTALTNVTAVIPYRKQYKPGQVRNVDSFYDHQVIYLNHGRAIAIASVDEDSTDVVPGVTANFYAATATQIKYDGLDAPLPVTPPLAQAIQASITMINRYFQDARIR